MKEKIATLSFSDGSPSVDFPILGGTVGPEVIDVRSLYGKTGKFTYDPGFMSTASCRSNITYIDGDEGILLYRGYPIEQLAEKCDFLEVAYLILNGELPTNEQKVEFDDIVTHHSMVHEQLSRFYSGFRRDAHPMAVMCGVVGALAAFYHAIDRILILHADHEQNASTSTVRLAGSTGANPFACISAGIASLWGPAHGGANEAVLKMLDEIGDIKNIPAFIKRVKEKDGQAVLMGFGHRVYKNYDPRAKLIQKTCHEVLEELDMKDNKLIKLAMELERIALSDEYFIKRKLYPNVDFYSGIVYKALGIPVSMYTAIFALARTVGWIAQWKELIADPEQKLSRPRQLFTGATARDFVPLGKRQ